MALHAGRQNSRMSLPLDPSSLPISDLTGDAVICVPPRASLREVADALTNQGIGAVGVGSSTEIVGIVSERDVVGAVAAGFDSAVTTAADIAETELIWATPDSTVGEVAAEMLDHWVRHVLVGDEGKVVGIVSARDLLGAYSAASTPEID